VLQAGYRLRPSHACVVLARAASVDKADQVARQGSNGCRLAGSQAVTLLVGLVRGVPGAAGLIRMALAARDDYEALATMANGVGGIYRFGPAMSSVVLAACRLTSSPSPTRGLCRPCADWD
jgi:hypothetical protein